MRLVRFAIFAAAACIAATAPQAAKIDPDTNAPCCQYDSVEAIVWYGMDSVMTISRLAAYCAPILWFSPDEPLIESRMESGIRIPAAFPFEAQVDTPVVYHRVRTIVVRSSSEGEAFTTEAGIPGPATIDLNKVVGLDLDFFFYYPWEEGLGRHRHDVESVQMKVAVWKREQCDECPYALVVLKIVGKAHGIQWYDNTLELDRLARFPIAILVEEGKHASCTDKNGDGYYTPGFDVNRRVNDAWGVRDVIRSGGLFASTFQSWFAKVREERDRVFPPLPPDAAARLRNPGEPYAEGYPQYQLRPFPPAERAVADPTLFPFIESKGSVDPEIQTSKSLKRFFGWVETESFVKSVSAAARYDGELGLSVTFPLLIVKGVSDPVAGGWLVNRVYFEDDGWRDFGYNVLYTPSASRWFDGYFSLGYERDGADDGSKTYYFAAETGIKFRAAVEHSMLGFMTKLSDFWGLRAGIRYRNAFPVHDTSFVLELGAGTW